jgi:hypothetical protein
MRGFQNGSPCPVAFPSECSVIHGYGGHDSGDTVRCSLKMAVGIFAHLRKHRTVFFTLLCSN